MASARDRARGGFTLIEMLVVIVCIGILAGFALDRLLPLIGRAERVAFMRIQSQLQNQLTLVTAERMVRGESATIPALAGSNPMDFLLKPPENYLGAFEGMPNDSPSGHWYFDTSTGTLVYQVGSHTRFDGLDGPADQALFQVRLAFTDENGDGVYQASRDRFDGIWLAPVYAYSWPD
jgi:general secretion pathway protein G